MQHKFEPMNPLKVRKCIMDAKCYGNSPTSLSIPLTLYDFLNFYSSFFYVNELFLTPKTDKKKSL